MIPANQRRVAGTKYIITDTAERRNQEPLNRLLKEIIKKYTWIEKLKRKKRKVKLGS